MRLGFVPLGRPTRCCATSPSGSSSPARDASGGPLSPKERRAAGLPHESTIGADDFMALTLDVWDIPPESAVRVRHPAPFPVELPQRLIELYTFKGDLVVDPFCGSGSTLVAARRCGRDAVGYDLDPEYVALAQARLGRPRRGPRRGTPPGRGRRRRGVGGDAGPPGDRGGRLHRRAGRTAACAGSAWRSSFTAARRQGTPWYFDVAGSNSAYRGGMARSETVWRALGSGPRHVGPRVHPLVVLTTQLPRPGTEGTARSGPPDPERSSMPSTSLSPTARQRLAAYATRALPRAAAGVLVRGRPGARRRLMR